MSTISQVGNYARYLNLVRNLSNGQNNVDELSRQMTTNKKSVDLEAYGPETQKLLDLRAELVKRENYVQNIDTAQPRVKAQDVVLTRLEQMASDWQSNNLMPFNPGPVSLTTPWSSNPDGLKLRINHEKSTFTQNAKYTVTSVPSATGENGTFDVTITDGLGGRTMRTLNLKKVPPNDGDGYNFEISGGPGSGAVLNLSFDKLAAAASSSFTVSWPQANQMRDRAEGALRDIRQLLNERFGDRYLFSGSRFGQEPVGDLMAGKQHSKVTFNGHITEPLDYFEVTVNGRVFSYQATGPGTYEVGMDGNTTTVAGAPTHTVTFIAQTLTTRMQAANLPVTVSTANGVITLIANDLDQKFDVEARVVNRALIDNSTDEATTTQKAGPAAGPPPIPAQPQIDRFTLNGAGVDIGDTFEFTVTVGDPGDPYNQKYYNTYPDEPRDLPPYQEYKVSYVVTPQDFAGGTTNVNAVADRLRQQFAKLDPQPPVGINPLGSGAGIELTSNSNLDPAHPNRPFLFSTKAKVTNGSLENSVTVATLPPESDPITDVPTSGKPNLPFYDTEFLTKGKNEKAWDKARVTAEDGLSLEYGVVSTDPAIQKLIMAFRMARVAATNPGKYEEYVSQSRELMAHAKDEVRGVHAKVASDLSTLEQKREAHKQAMNGVVDQIAGIEGIDQTEVAARLRSSMNALEAAYTVAGQTQKMSLINYIA